MGQTEVIKLFKGKRGLTSQEVYAIYLKTFGEINMTNIGRALNRLVKSRDLKFKIEEHNRFRYFKNE
jgi:hypothetical protein